jgi:hypothetical protein
MTVLSVVTLLLVLGTLFVLIELGGAPVGFESEMGFHAVSRKPGDRGVGSRVLRRKDQPADVRPIADTSVAAR